MRHILPIVFLLLSGMLVGQSTSPTNLIVIYADDLGWSDISVNGGDTPTPNIDKLFNEGMRLDNYTTHAVCSPSRAGLLTGRHYLNVRHSGVYTDGELSTDELTISKAFQTAGFATGAFGKWHNGESPTDGSAPGPHVNEYGFDRFVGYYGGGPDHFTRETGSGDKYFWFHDETHRPDETGFTSDLIDQYALEFLEAHKNERFFCYVAEQMVHSPYQAKYEDYINTPASVRNGLTLYDETTYTNYMENDNLPESHRPIVYSAMISTLDRSVGSIMQWLEANNLIDDTMVVFLSDNGANSNGSNLPFRDGKHSVYEGGIHVPGAVYWPNGGLTGGHEYVGDFNYLDVTPTLCSIFEVPFDPDVELDGRDLSTDILAKTNNTSKVQNWVNVEYGATRIDGWKLLYNHDDMRLYDLLNDVDESSNLANSNPTKLDEMVQLHEAWLDENGFFPNYRPPVAYIEDQPAPEGDVLEFYAEQTGTVDNYQSGMEFRFARGPGEPSLTPGLGGDVIEFDIYVASDGRNEGFYFSPMRNSTNIEIQSEKVGYDQYGRLQSEGPGVQEGTCAWEHRVIGVGNMGPVGVRWVSVALAGRAPGTYHFYIDNLKLRKADGTVVDIWTNNSHYRSDWDDDLMITPNHSAFGTVDLRVVNLSEVGQSTMELELVIENGSSACDLGVSVGNAAPVGDYSWYVNDELVSNASESLSGNVLNEGDVVRCEIVGSFGCDSGSQDILEDEITISLPDIDFQIHHNGTPIEDESTLALWFGDKVSYTILPEIDPVMWLDAFHISDGTAPNDGDPVLNWADRANSSDGASISNQAVAPTYDSEGFNGLPALIFGENGGSVLELFDTSEDGFFEDDWTIFLVGEIQQHNDWTNTIGNKFVTDGAGWFFRYSNAGKTALAAGSNVTQGTVYGFPWSSVSTISKVGSTISLHTNGSAEISSVLPGGETFTNSSPIYLGQKDDSEDEGRYHRGPISEVIVFDRALSNTEREYVEGYLAHKWQLVDKLSSTHSYKSYSPVALSLNHSGGQTDLSISGLTAEISIDESSDFGDYEFYRIGCTDLFYSFNVVSANGPLSSHGQVEMPFLIYPNPVSDVLTVEQHAEAGGYEVIDLVGKILDRGSLDESGTVDVSGLDSGIYFLNVVNSEGEEWLFKFRKL